jgi:hypothetical protein
MRAAIAIGVLAWIGSAWAQTTVSFDAIDGRGRQFHFEKTRGKVVALTFGSRNTQQEARLVNEDLRRRAGRDFTVVSVVDFEGIPVGGRDMARRKVMESDKFGLKHLVDDDGSLAKELGARPTQAVDIFVIDRDGRLVGRYDEDSLKAAEQQIETLRRRPSAGGKRTRT